MSQLIETLYISGRTLYVTIHAGGQIWNKDTAVFESYNQANWTHYALALTEQTSSGYYSAAYPSGIAAYTLSTECLYAQGGATPVLPGSVGGDSFLTMFQSQGANVQTISGNGAAAGNLGLSAGAIVQGSALTGTLSTTQMTTNLTNAINNSYVGRIIIFTSGVLQGQATNITAYDGTTKKLSFSAVTTAPSNGDTFIIV